MSSQMLGGIGLTMIAGVMSGNCMLPMKFARQWRWENVWLVFSLVSLLVLPWGLALVFLKHPLEVYREVPWGVMTAPLLFGAGWGIAQILFGISVRRLGMGVGYAIIVGLGAVLGTLVPLFVGQRKLIAKDALAEIYAGIVVMVLGVALTALGGQVRERASRVRITDGQEQSGYLAAILLAVLCGVMAPMLNYSFAFGQGLATTAMRLGATRIAAVYAVWPVGLLGGLVPNVAYSLYLLRRRKSWHAYVSSGRDAVWPVLMAVLWMGAMSLYGMSAVYLGTLGTSIGWGLFQIFMIMTATLSGMLTAEWKSAPRRAMMFLGMGMMSLVCATLLLSLGGR